MTLSAPPGLVLTYLKLSVADALALLRLTPHSLVWSACHMVLVAVGRFSLLRMTAFSSSSAQDELGGSG